MKFYEELSKYYEEVFPKGKLQMDFLIQEVGDSSKTIIDIACGNGVYAVELAKRGHNVLALDLSEGMIEKTRSLAQQEQVKLNTKIASMLQLEEVAKNNYDIAFCIGNSLVHLASIEEVEDFIRQVYHALKETGKLILQIINYDRILDKNIKALPAIENKNRELAFTREYLLSPLKDKVEFRTVLTVRGEKWENSVDLLALRKDVLVEIMERIGFKIEQVYGGFDREDYKADKSFHCIVVGNKM